MAVATFTDIEKAYAGRSILRGISFELQQGQKIGLVGPNGAGKTTLLKLLAGEETPDHGEVSIAKSVKWTYVSQQPRLDPEETLRHQVSLVFEELHAIEKQMHETADLLSVHTSGPEHDAVLKKYGELEHHFQHMGGYDIERRVETVLDELGFAQRDLDLPIKALSGGQKSRAQIARLLLEAPDLMFLDEPTNHLDLPMLDWLEETLNEMTDTTLVVVSHDRYFMDSVVDEILELKDGKIEHFPGNYSAYIDLRQQRLLAQQHSFEQQRAYIEKQEEYIRRLRRRFAMQARGRKTRLNRLKESGLINKPRFKDKSLILNLKVPKASGYDVLKAEGLSKAFPDKMLFENVDITVVRGKRLGIIGPNGSGKTTLLNILAGELPADSGEVKWGYGVALQFYKQEHQDLDPNNNVIDELQSVRVDAKQQELRDLAALFLFSGDTIEKKLSVLSGGEKSRVAMAKLLLKPTNTILMDEPTNHLDIATCDVLEEALDSYDGTLILVSHDRFFMDQVCDQLLVLQRPREPGGKPTWKLYNGSYTDYLAAIAKEKEQAVANKRQSEKAQRQAQQKRDDQEKARESAAARKNAGTAKPKISQKFAKFSLQQIESQIVTLESDISSLEESFANPKVAANPQAVKDLKQKYDAKKRDLAELTAAWEVKAESAT